jgi:hypothetical protein
MARKVSDSGAGRSHLDGKASPETGQDGKSRAALARRALLSRGGVVAAGVAGAGALGMAAAGPASAASGDPVLQDTVNNAGSSATPTELDASNNTAPAFILTNTGVDPANGGSGPNLRLTPSPSTATGDEPTASTSGGDLTATADGYLWFTHDFTANVPTGVLDPAPMLTEAIGNVYAPLSAPVRILDTRSSSGRANILNPSGNLDSHGRLLAGKRITISAYSLVYFADALFGNLTVTDTAGAGFLTVWEGATSSPPNASSINFGAHATLSNFVATGIGVGVSGTTHLPVFAIYAEQTTHVILDVAGFSTPGFQFVKFSFSSGPLSLAERSARIREAREAMRKDRRA